MRRFALLLGVALSLLSTSAIAQFCDGFVDVLASSPFCPDVTWLKTYGITKGCDATHYCPTDNVSRLQMAAFMHRLGQNPAFVQGGNAFGVNPAVLGTTDNISLQINVANAAALLIRPDTTSPILVGGSYLNMVTAGASGGVIGGGGAFGIPGSTLLGSGCGLTLGCANFVTDAFGTIGGGAGNQAGDNQGTASDHPFATVGGGISNLAYGYASTVGGGYGNGANGTYATVAGGTGNIAGGTDATVAGGIGNIANGNYATVAGGFSNTAQGNYSIVAGGAFNTASGSTSFAAGYLANADQDGCFVYASWSFVPGNPMSCLGSMNIAKFGLDHGLSVDYGAARMDGGGTRYLAIGDTSTGNTIAAWSGAVLTDGGAWTNASDRALKADFTTVDAQAVLAKVASLPIDEWSYKAEGGQRHLGPVAQDFYAAFGLGADDKHITTVDEGGVALAAIKGLYERTEKELEARDREIAALREELDAIKAALNRR